MRQQWHLFLLALGFLTRIPVPADTHYSPEALNRCCRYFSLVGWLLGGLLAGLWLLTEPVFGASVTSLVVLAASLLLTGAFHEDGLADTADGLGGAFERERKLAIMKDSRIGTYGSAALVMSLLFRWQLLTALGDAAPLALLTAAAASRALSTSLMLGLPYCRMDEESKSKPLVTRSDPNDIAICLGIALLPLIFWPATLLLIACCGGLLVLGLMRFYRKALGGYTGDLLGAAQQIAEITILGLCLAMLAG